MAIAETLAMSSLSNSVLPDVLVEEILVRLPVKPIGRFRCVSKPWRTLLSSPKFIKSHNKLQILKPAGNLIAFSPGIEGYGDAYITTVNSGVAKKLQPEMIYLKVLGSCNGLLLLGNIRGFILINPITLENVHILDDRLGYDGHESVSFYYGFGYDSSSDDYKIVSLMQFVGYYGEPIVDIYSVRMKSWKRLGNSPYTLHYKNVCDCHAFANCGRDPVGVFLNGRIHWLGYNDVRYYEIVCFDLEREEFVEGLMPDSLRKEYGKGEEWLESGAKVLNGCLALVSFLDVYTMNLWVMREYGVQDSWMKFTTICCKDDEDPDHVNDVVCELNEDEIVLGNSNCGSGYKLFAYNWRNGISRNLVMDGLPPDGAFDAVPFQASLESPNFYVN